jgi:hypothetical protein
VQSKADYSLFIRQDGSSFIALLVYVDDILIASSDATAVTKLKQFLDAQFKLKDLGGIPRYLGDQRSKPLCQEVEYRAMALVVCEVI